MNAFDRAQIIAERDAQIVAWLTKKAGEFGRSNRENRTASDAVALMADKLSRGAVRDDETGVSELYRLRSENNRLRSEARQLQNDITGACLARYEEEQENARLLEERHSTNEALSDAAEQLRVQRDRIAELEAATVCPSIARLHGSKCVLPIRHRGDHRNETKRHYWSDEYATPVPQQRQLEDPHTSPLHHDYAVGRDLPFIPGQTTGRCPQGHTFEDCTCGGAA